MRMENPSWGWGLSLIAFTIAIHAAAVVIMTFVSIRIRARLESQDHSLWKLIAVLIGMIVVVGLLLAVLHALECMIWAAAYWRLGAVGSFLYALLYSVDSMSTRGASGLTLQRHWQMMGALEAVDGMLLFGVSAAYIFAVMQIYWSMLSAHTTQEKLTL
jgi:hypothetical protein